jgi:hypothetical protein
MQLLWETLNFLRAAQMFLVKIERMVTSADGMSLLY